MKFYPYEKGGEYEVLPLRKRGGGRKVLAMLKGGGAGGGVFYAVA